MTLKELLDAISSKQDDIKNIQQLLHKVEYNGTITLSCNGGYHIHFQQPTEFVAVLTKQLATTMDELDALQQKEALLNKLLSGKAL